MAEAEPGGNQSAAQDPAGAGLEPAEIERLADLVYRLIKEEIIRTKERRGEPLTRDWR